MMESNARLVPALGALVLALAVSGCADGSPVAPPSDGDLLSTPDATLAVRAVPDVGGDWQFHNTVRLGMPDWFVEQVLNALPQNDVTPEGPVTHGVCESTGVMTLAQDGATFTGVAVRSTLSCETMGGQSFQSPGVAFPLTVAGEIVGTALSFTYDNPGVRPCPYHGVVMEMDGDWATEIQATGRCVIPGHPQSESVMVADPPPGGTSKSLRFEAWRS